MDKAEMHSLRYKDGSANGPETKAELIRVIWGREVTLVTGFRTSTDIHPVLSTVFFAIVQKQSS
jgi:hypothetical protein